MKADNKITVRKEEDKSQYYARYPAWSMTGTVNGDKEKMGKEYSTKQKHWRKNTSLTQER